MTLRVLHLVSSTQRRGAEIFTAQLVHALDGRMDQRVAVLHASGDGSVSFDAPTAFLDGDRGRVPGLRMSVPAVRRLRGLIGSWDPAVVQLSGGELLKHTVPAAAGRPARVVYRRIGSAGGRAFHGLRRASYARLMRRAAAVVTVADSVRRETVEMFRLPPERVTTIPGGRDPSALRPVRGREATREALGIPTEAPVTLSLGALTWEKDPVAAVEAAARVRGAFPGLVHLIAGDGPLRGAVDRAVREHGLQGAVRVLGSRDDVPDVLAATDVLVLTSRSEGIPGCLIEAGMVGLPAVSYDLSGVPEVVDGGRTGVLVPAGDVAALSAEVVRLLGDERLRGEMGAAARIHCARFDMAAIAGRYADLFEELVST